MLNLLNNIKNYLIALFAAIAGILAILFIYEKRKVEVNSAVLGEVKTDKDLADMNAQINSNNEILKQQETDRTKLENEKSNEDNTDTIINNLNKLK